MKRTPVHVGGVETCTNIDVNRIGKTNQRGSHEEQASHAAGACQVERRHCDTILRLSNDKNLTAEVSCRGIHIRGRRAKNPVYSTDFACGQWPLT